MRIQSQILKFSYVSQPWRQGIDCTRVTWARAGAVQYREFLRAHTCMAHLKVRQCNEPCSLSGGQKRTPPAVRELPSRWYTLLALPFPDQQVGRREIARAHRHAHRAGHFSNPLWVRWRLYLKVPTACGTRHRVDMVADVESPLNVLLRNVIYVKQLIIYAIHFP